MYIHTRTYKCVYIYIYTHAHAYTDTYTYTYDMCLLLHLLYNLCLCMHAWIRDAIPAHASTRRYKCYSSTHAVEHVRFSFLLTYIHVVPGTRTRLLSLLIWLDLFDFVSSCLASFVGGLVTRTCNRSQIDSSLKPSSVRPRAVRSRKRTLQRWLLLGLRFCGFVSSRESVRPTVGLDRPVGNSCFTRTPQLQGKLKPSPHQTLAQTCVKAQKYNL